MARWQEPQRFPVSIRIWVSTLLLALGCVAAQASEGSDPAPTAPMPAVTRHTGVFGGVPVHYTATAQWLAVSGPDGRGGARIFSVAYTKDGIDTALGRPVMFLFNGGPGSAAIWLHMGAFGPRRIDVPEEGVGAGVAPYGLKDNPSSLLDVADLVFIDPVGTGFSHAVGPSKDDDFWTLTADADSVSEFIRIWLATNRRENSPKYLLGESYGSVRAAVVIRNLQGGKPGKITFNGLILLGQDLDTTETQQTPGNDTPFVIYLPTYAVTAWYHGKIDRSDRTLDAFLEDAREFARGEYARALFLGSSISSDERKRVAARAAAFMGLPAALIERENLRIGTAQFLRELCKDDGKILIRSDTRYTVPATETVFEQGGVSDPPGLYEAFTAAGSDYLRSELRVVSDSPYVLLANAKWDYTLPDGLNHQQTYHNVAPFVATAMRANTGMRLFMGSGYYDLLAAFMSMERTATHSGLPLDRITMRTYPSGHMIFVSKPSLAQLAEDLRAFIRSGSP